MRILSMMMGVWLATSFTGGFIAGWLGSLWSAMDKVHFFLMIAAIVGVAGLVIAAFNRPLKGILDKGPQTLGPRPWPRPAGPCPMISRKITNQDRENRFGRN